MYYPKELLTLPIPINKKRDTDDNISSLTHCYTNYKAPSYSALN